MYKIEFQLFGDDPNDDWRQLGETFTYRNDAQAYHENSFRFNPLVKWARIVFEPDEEVPAPKTACVTHERLRKYIAILRFSAEKYDSLAKMNTLHEKLFIGKAEACNFIADELEAILNEDNS